MSAADSAAKSCAARGRGYDLAARLLDHFAAGGCVLPSISLLQPADLLLETIGEDLRRRIFLTTGRKGESLCLRPEFTIPVCLHHLASGAGPARYGYAGLVFRQRQDEPVEFRQAGIEDIGGTDRLSADIAAILDCMEALRCAGVLHFSLMLGDQALFDSVLASLDLPLSWQKRLGRAFGDMTRLRDDLRRLSTGNGDALRYLEPELRRMVENGDAPAVEHWITESMRKAGLSTSSGRTPAAITQRVMEKAELAATKLGEEQRAALAAYLEIECPAAEAADALAAIAARYGLRIESALDEFSARTAALSRAGVGEGAVLYRAGFGRRLDYYTGLVFEITVSGRGKPIAGGGRYDRLMTLLGSPISIPAVGFSIWLDRIAGGEQRS